VTAKFHFTKSLALFPTYDVPKKWLQELPQFKSSPDYESGYTTTATQLKSQYQKAVEAGDPERAYVYIRKATYVEPKNSDYRQELLKLYLQGKYFDDAQQELTNLKRLNPDYQLPPELAVGFNSTSPTFK
jgi:tetratricopeptide (TPR) repeat protein